MDAGHRHAAVEIDDFSVCTDIGLHSSIVTDGNNEAVFDGCRLRPAALRIHRVHAAIEQNEIGGVLLRLRVAGGEY